MFKYIRTFERDFARKIFKLRKKTPSFHNLTLCQKYLKVADHCHILFDREMFKEKGSIFSNTFVLLKEILQEKSSSSEKKAYLKYPHSFR